TLNVLKAAHQAQIKRIVFTSTALTVGTKTEPDQPFTEDHWNENDKIPYIYAKTQAEQKAWEFTKEKELDLVAVLPTGIIGPYFYRYTPTTIIFRDYVQGTVRGVTPGIFNFIDVRDVAKAHILAYENPNASGRYICGTEAISVKELFEMLESEFPELKFPRRKLSSFIINLFALFSRKHDRTEANMFINFRLFYDSSKIRTDLGWTPRPIEESLRDTINWVRTTPITYLPYYQ
ncbi:MAG: NAD-dependent epimerase/dehydratase family protein, partial [Candidatus Hodarchaeota archaeon]